MAISGNTTGYFTNGPGGAMISGYSLWTDINGLYTVPDAYYYDASTDTSWYVSSGTIGTAYVNPCYVAPTPPPPTPPPPTPDPCFLYGTEIKMADGSNKLIEDLVLGDVLSSLSIEGLDKNVEKNWLGFSVDEFSYTHSTAVIVNLIHGSYSSYYIINNSIRITYEHPVFIKKGDEYKFCKVYNLSVGDLLFNTDGVWIEIQTIEFINETCQTVGVNIEDDDVYFGSGILVHNAPQDKEFQPE
jgi:hypothetical protein